MINNARPLRGGLWVAVGFVVAVVSGGGCARIDSGGQGGGGGNGPSGADGSYDLIAPDAARDSAVDSGPKPKPCVNLQCQQVTCPAGSPPTSISGTVFAPNGKLPLYNVIVYVPNAPLEPFPTGLTCDRCGATASGKPLVSAVSDSEGKFKITNVPTGANVPLVMQVGKWRRKVMLPSVTACQDNPIADPNLTRLPRNRMEGDLPKIAATTGVCDQLGCLLPKLGIDVAELGVAGQDKAVTYYNGGSLSPTDPMDPGSQFGPPNMRPTTELWNDEAALSQYDLAILSCECSENLVTKNAGAFAAMTNYLAKGGRIFGSHYSYVWLKNTPDPPLINAVSIITTTGGIGASPLTIDTSFPKGKALADWMKFVDPAVTHGQIAARTVFNNVQSVMAPSGLAWASSPTRGGIFMPMVNMDPRPRIVTVNTPAGLPADKQCGRAAHLDAHIVVPEAAAPMPMGMTFPGICGTTLSKGEEALAFLFFDLASCIQDEKAPVEPPPIIVP